MFRVDSEERPLCWWRITVLAVACAAFIAGVTLFGTQAADAARLPSHVVPHAHVLRQLLVRPLRLKP